VFVTACHFHNNIYRLGWSLLEWNPFQDSTLMGSLVALPAVCILK
jgi:hypothetical protein